MQPTLILLTTETPKNLSSMKMLEITLEKRTLKVCAVESVHAAGKMAQSIMVTGIRMCAMEWELTALVTALLFMKVLGLTIRNMEKEPKLRRVELLSVELGKTIK